MTNMVFFCFQFNFSDLVSSLSARSFGSFGSHRSTQSTCSVNRPWSRVSRRQYVTLIIHPKNFENID